ncbi:MAG TPA: LptA/OstA family protein [Chthoniobacterales bacterium]|nr:LptA/OstA family protein [Chthoniobacterales bacterium]
MRKLGLVSVLCFGALAGVVSGQGSAPATLSTRTPAKVPEKTAEKTPAAKPKEVKESPEKSPEEKAKETKAPPASQEPIVTEIYADKVVFDSAKSTGVFTGHIVVTDPRFQIQGDKLTIFLSSKQSEGLDRAIVEGNVGVVRERPATEGGEPSRMVGRSDKAVYTAKNGNFELTGNPRVQQGLNIHVATSPETVMILNETGQLQTNGPSRTEIRQAPKAEATPKP